MTLLKLCFVFFFLIVSQFAFSQDISVEISFDTVYDGTASFTGKKIMRMRGYDLQMMVSEVFGVQKNVVRMDEAFQKRTLSLKIETIGYISETDLKPAFIKALKELTGASVEIKTEQVSVWVAYLPNDQSISKKRCIVKEGVDRSVSQTTGLWMASCVTTRELTNKLSEWSDKIVLNETLTNDTYDFTIRNKPWPELVNDLKVTYGIVLTEEKRAVEMINIHQ